MQDLQYFKEAYGEEKYKNWDGREITEKQFEKRLQYCTEMAFTTDKITHVTVPCADWVLTYEGDMMIADYIVEKYLDIN
jgi:hypothetical protein